MPESLVSEMQGEHWKWAFSTRLYGTIYPTVRLTLITASAVVAAKDNLSDSPLGSLVIWVPAIALMVSIVTAVDTWMKPRDKWRGFMRDRDDLADLLLRLRAVGANDTATLDEIRTEFAMLRRRHREANIY